MDILFGILKVVLTVIIAFMVGKLVTKIKMPAILGWLITGMILGPYAFNVLSNEIIGSSIYKGVSKFFECIVGLMFAKELVLKKLKKYGKQIMTITIFESVGTFVFVSLVFGIIFYFINVPLYLALVFGSIALATAPAPSLSIVNEFKTSGSITNTLVPLAILDDIVAIIVFFSINSYIMTLGAAGSQSVIAVVGISILLPIGIGVAVGLILSCIYNLISAKNMVLLTTLASAVFMFSLAYIIDNFILPTPLMNFMMVGMAGYTTVANCVDEEKMEKISQSIMPLLGIAFVLMILNLAAPLDYKLILGAGVMTAIYIITRGLGKYFSAYIGAKVSGAEPTVRKYLGFTILPHSGVSLVFTGMAVVSLNTFDTDSATLISGTIAAAAIINEIIAVILAKKGFEWGGEISKDKE